jgi:hypothetical protein
MRVLLVSEGLHELTDAVWGEDSRNGALEVLVRRLLDCEAEIVCCKPNDRAFRRTRVHGKGHAYEKIVVAFLLEAERRRFDAVVFLIDEDGDRERRAALDSAQISEQSILPRACGVAVRSFDAWILADESALAAVLRGECNAEKNPERLKDPKSKCLQKRDDSRCGLRLRDLYSEYAKQVDLTLLKERCPKGFAPFARRVEGLSRSGST